MKKEKVILVNKNSNRSQRVIDYLKTNDKKYLLCTNLKKTKEDLKDFFEKGYTDFIVCGGDGAINKFLNEYAKLPKFKREKVRLGIVPCGRANDLARALKIPLNIEKSFKLIEKENIKEIDIIKVNNSYFITGGGLGLPTEIITDVERYSNIKKKIMGESVYLWATLKKFLFGYKGIILNKKRLLAIYVLNQSFIGKKFKIAPEAKNDDGLMNIKYVGMPPTFFSKFKTLSWGSKGKIDHLPWVKGDKKNSLQVSLETNEKFMGDGEILEEEKDFSIKVLKKDLKIFVN